MCLDAQDAEERARLTDLYRKKVAERRKIQDELETLKSQRKRPVNALKSAAVVAGIFRRALATATDDEKFDLVKKLAERVEFDGENIAITARFFVDENCAAPQGAVQTSGNGKCTTGQLELPDQHWALLRGSGIALRRYHTHLGNSGPDGCALSRQQSPFSECGRLARLAGQQAESLCRFVAYR
jgi:hypothetical protein